MSRKQLLDTSKKRTKLEEAGDDIVKNNMLEEQERLINKHMDWSDQQRRILSSNGFVEQYYNAERGFPFTLNELPHNYISSSKDIFSKWKAEYDDEGDKNCQSPIVGIWKRTLFYGSNCYDVVTQHDEITFNIQTTTLFIDLRIPKTRDLLLCNPISNQQIHSLSDLNIQQLQYYSRQHIFAGYTRLVQSSTTTNTATDHQHDTTNTKFPYCATRYHCIDWNYIGTPRSRPNKWYIELPSTISLSLDETSTEESHPPLLYNQWKEWGYATNLYGQQCYCEYWERHIDNSYHNNHIISKQNNRTESIDPIILILRTTSNSSRDGILIIYNDHIMYCIDRDASVRGTQNSTSTTTNNDATIATSLVGLIDEFIALSDVQKLDCELSQQQLQNIRYYLSIQGGHGRFIENDADSLTSTSLTTNKNGSWTLDHCIEFWKQGTSMFDETHNGIKITGTTVTNCTIYWNDLMWSIFDYSKNLIRSIHDIDELINNGPSSIRVNNRSSNATSIMNTRLPKV